MNRVVAVVMLAAGLMAGAAQAQSLPKTHVKVLGGSSNLAAYYDHERPFWTDTVPRLSDGQVSTEIRGFDEVGLQGPEILHLMSQGVVEFGTVPLTYIAGNHPIDEAVDLAGLTENVEEAHAVADSFLPVLSKFYAQNGDIKVLGISPQPAQVLFCNAEIKSLADVRGKKVLTNGRSQADFIEALGGSSVTMAFGEVLAALHGKVVDCAITGALTGYNARWYEVTTHLYALPISWDVQLHAVGQKTWDRLDPKVQEFLLLNIGNMIDGLWEAAASQTQTGYDCNSGADACAYTVKGRMVLVRPSDADKLLLKKVMQQQVLPKWAARCSAACVQEFNASIAKIVGLSARR